MTLIVQDHCRLGGEQPRGERPHQLGHHRVQLGVDAILEALELGVVRLEPASSVLSRASIRAVIRLSSSSRSCRVATSAHPTGGTRLSWSTLVPDPCAPRTRWTADDLEFRDRHGWPFASPVVGRAIRRGERPVQATRRPSASRARAKGSTAVAPARRRARAATVSVQRESATSSTSSTGPPAAQRSATSAGTTKRSHTAASRWALLPPRPPVGPPSA